MNQQSYLWSGVTLHGKKSAGEITAISKHAALARLTQQGFIYLKIQKKTYLKLFSQRRKKISIVSIALFFRQLAALLTAGIPLVQCCDILLYNPNQYLLDQLLKSIKKELENGGTLSASLKAYPRYFDALTCQLVQIAEATGTLDIMLQRIADYKEKLLASKNKLKQALLYPAIVLITALLVTISLLIFVVPQFAELFQSLNGKLPFLTLKVIQLSDWICRYYWLSLFPLAGSSLFFKYYKKSSRLTNCIDHLILVFPITGNLLKKIIHIRFTQTLATLLGAGIPLNEALQMLIGTQINQVYQAAIHRLRTHISAGQQLHTAMQAAAIYPSLLIQMIKVGEESGTLVAMLEKIAEFYTSEMDYQMANLSQLLEPLIIIILGVLIGGLVIAMYLPIFKLGTVF